MKLIEKTPKSMACGPFAGCPAVFETDHGTYIVIGKQLSQDQINKYLAGRVGKNETAIEFPEGLLDIVRTKNG